MQQCFLLVNTFSRLKFSRKNHVGLQTNSELEGNRLYCFSPKTDSRLRLPWHVLTTLTKQAFTNTCTSKIEGLFPLDFPTKQSF